MRNQPHRSMQAQSAPFPMAFPYLLVATVVIVSGCNYKSGYTQGEQGNLSFYEPNTYPADEWYEHQGFELAVAVGGQVDVSVGQFAAIGHSIQGCSLYEAETDNPEVLAVDGMGGGIWPLPHEVLRLSALSAGTTRLTVYSACTPVGSGNKLSDSIQIRTAEPDEVRLQLDLGGLYSVPVSEGFSLRPGATLDVTAKGYHQGDLLLGFNVFQWIAEPALVTFSDVKTDTIPASGTVNSRIIEANGDSGVALISTQLGGSRELGTLSFEDEVQLKIYTLTQELFIPIEVDALGSSDTIFTLAGYDANGRYVLPSADDELGFTAWVSEGALVVLEVRKYGRTFAVRGCEGSGVITLSYMGAELAVPIEISAEQSDPECEADISIPEEVESNLP
jgi:hypothetical protein